MIEFKYEDQIDVSHASVTVTTTCEGAESVVETFKTFLRLVGYADDTVDRIVFEDDDSQEVPVRNANPLELFPEDDEHAEGGI